MLFPVETRKTQETKEFNCACSRCILTRLRRDCVRLGLRVTGYWACKTHPGQQTALASLATRKLDSTSIVSPTHRRSPATRRLTYNIFPCKRTAPELFQLLPCDRNCKWTTPFMYSDVYKTRCTFKMQLFASSRTRLITYWVDYSLNPKILHESTRCWNEKCRNLSSCPINFAQSAF